MNPGDDIAARVRQHVSTLVPEQLVDAVTQAVGLTLATLMNDPTFTSQLRVVADLRQENLLLRQADVMLRQNVLQLQRALALKAPQRPAPRKRAPKKAAASKASTSAFKAEVRRSMR